MLGSNDVVPKTRETVCLHFVSKSDMVRVSQVIVDYYNEELR